MKITVQVPKEIEIVAMRCLLPVNYEEEDMPNDYPGRLGEIWKAVIDMDTGQIHNWPTSVPARKLNMKVVDGGCYYLIASDGSVAAALEQEYVPTCIPQEYGDYINFEISESGRITNWSPDARSVRRCFFTKDEEE